MPAQSRLPTRFRRLARKVEWVYVLEAARWLYTHGRRSWDRLSERERRELSRLVRKTRGNPTNLSASERAELQRIVLRALGFER